MSSAVLKRPVLRWHGGKWRLAPWIISHFPQHRTYVEPFGGGASVLLRKDRAYAEVYNDLDGEVVNLFRVLQSANAERLVCLLEITPFARAEFENAYHLTDDPVERARRLIIRSFMGFGSGLGVMRRATGFRGDSKKAGSTPAHDWQRYPQSLRRIVERMSGVVIENRPAVDVMSAADRSDTLHYVDPPYLHVTRSSKSNGGGLHHCYAVEMTDQDHVDLLTFLRTLSGSVILSGYPHALYDDALHDWHRVEKEALADGARKRTEVLWMNFNPKAAPPPGGMFAMDIGE